MIFIYFLWQGRSALRAHYWLVLLGQVALRNNLSPQLARSGAALYSFYFVIVMLADSNACADGLTGSWGN